MASASFNFLSFYKTITTSAFKAGLDERNLRVHHAINKHNELVKAGEAITAVPINAAPTVQPLQSKVEKGMLAIQGLKINLEKAELSIKKHKEARDKAANAEQLNREEKQAAWADPAALARAPAA